MIPREIKYVRTRFASRGHRIMAREGHYKCKGEGVTEGAGRRRICDCIRLMPIDMPISWIVLPVRSGA